MPSSLAFITSGSRGNRLLFYTRGNAALPEQGGKKDVLLELPPTTLAEILAPSSLMMDRKFELSVDEWKFIGHPFSIQNASFSITFNVVFVFQSHCSPEAIRAYDHLSHMIGSAIIHEEKKCGYLREQVALLMQLLEDADIPDPSADDIVNESSLAQSMNTILCSLQAGKQKVQVRINSWSEINTLIAPGVTAPAVPTPDTDPTSSLPSVRSYSALLLYESPKTLLSSLPPTCNPAMHRLLQAVSPMKSLQALSLDADIPLLQTLRIASHLVMWGCGMTIYPLSESNMYITSPSCNTRVQSKLAHRFASAFPSPSKPLPEVLSHFSLPVSLGDIKEIIVNEKIIHIVVFLLQHKQIVQLHTYVYIVPTIHPSSSSSGYGGEQSKLRDAKSADSEGEELLSHLSPEEIQSVLSTSAASDPEDLEQFSRLSKYFHGNHHLEGIMLMENIPRSQLLTLIDKFSEVLVTCTLPEHTAIITK